MAVGVHDHLDQAARSRLPAAGRRRPRAGRRQVLGQEAAVGGQRQAGRLHVAAGGARGLFRQADPGDLGQGVDYPRHGVIAHPVAARAPPGNDVRGDLAHARGGVSEQRAAGHVADGVEAGHVGAHELVHRDAAAVEQRANRLQSQPGRVGDAAGGQQHQVGGLLPFPRRRLDGHPGGADRGHPRPRMPGDPRQCALELAHEVGVHARQNLLQQLHHRHLDADRVEIAGKLHPDVAAADDHHARRQVLQLQRAGAVHDVRQAGAGDRRAGAARSGRDDDVAGAQLAAVHRQPAAAGQARAAGFHGDPAALHLRRYPGTQARGDRLLPRHGGAQVVAGTLYRDAVGGAVARLLQQLGRVDQGLGGDAAGVETHPAEVVAFHQRRAQAARRGPFRGHVAARAAAHHGHVEVTHRRRSTRIRGSRTTAPRAGRGRRWLPPVPAGSGPPGRRPPCDDRWSATGRGGADS